jgi:putative nucleotidyltransferase with HDIG domain
MFVKNMRLDPTFLFSKVARRIFWLFVLCALVPIAVLSVVSVIAVTAQLNEQSHRLLRQTSRESAMNIFAHIIFLEGDMRLIGSSLQSGDQLTLAFAQTGLSGKLEDRFKGLEILTENGEHHALYGKVDAEPGFSRDERQFLDSSKTLLLTRTCASPVPCVLLSQELSGPNSGRGTLVAELDPSHLWDADNLPPLISLCVLDDVGRALYCPDVASSQLPPAIVNSASGQFEWKNGSEEFLSDYWTAPLKAHFLTSHWTVIASESRTDMLAPLNNFKRSFFLTVLLALWVVLLLSLIQIRRNMVPLVRLQEGTRRITTGDLGARVTVPGADEFAELASSFNFMAARIEKQVNSLKTANEIDRAILSSLNIEQIVDALIVGMRGLIPYEFVCISLLDPHSTLQAFTYVSTADSATEKQISWIELTPEESSALNQSPEIASLSPGEIVPSYLAPLAKHGMAFFLVAPIHLKGKLSAIISFGNSCDCKWSKEDKQRAGLLADQVAVAISNAQLVAELKQLHWGTLTALARAIDAKSHWTAGHSERVTNWAMKIARVIGLPEQELEIIHRGGLLHDIGKIGTPLAILDKPGKLTSDEMQQMREHVLIGARILEPIPGFSQCMPIVLQHHEWIDGSGYPKGLKGDEITLHARIFAVADCYDALISDRPYRPGMAPERVMEILTAGMGKQFDAYVVEQFSRLLQNESVKNEAEPLIASPVVVTWA